MAYALSLRKLA